MISSLYIFFGIITLLLFLIAFFDWSANHQKIAGFPAIGSFITSMMMFAFSWKVTTLSNGVEFSAMQSWESYGIALFWFMLAVISFLLSVVIYIEKPLTDVMN